MSAHISEPNSQFYVGTLNGVMYRIRPGALAQGGKSFALEPFEALPQQAFANPAIPADVKPPAAAPASAPASTIERTVDDLAEDALNAQILSQIATEKAMAAAKLFKREGAEPLRAGHPDLWALLVSGTTLEGTSFPKTLQA